MEAAVKTGERWLSASLNALVQMEEALSILDQIPGYADISAHLDLALGRLREKVDPIGAAQANVAAMRSIERASGLGVQRS